MSTTQYQYQPITGPVWREPVAEKLGWLPSDRYSGRSLARAPLRDWSVYPLQPPAVAYDPNVLDWAARDAYAGRSPPRARLDWSVGTLQPLAAAYDPAALDWLARDRYAGRVAPRGRLDFGESFQFAFVYDLVDWLPSDRYSGRALPSAARRDSTVLPPRVVAAAYDPSTLEWQPKGREPQAQLERRRLGDFAQPPFAALYAPSDLQWVPSDRYVQRGLARALFDVTVEPFQVSAPAYDPRTLEWTPQGAAPRVAVERRSRGDFQQPPFAALYRPERLEWQPADRYAGRAAPRARYDSTVEPRLVVVVPYDPSQLGWLASDRYYGRALPASRQSMVVYDPTTPEPILADARARFVATVEQSVFGAAIEAVKFDAGHESGVFSANKRIH